MIIPLPCTGMPNRREGQTRYIRKYYPPPLPCPVTKYRGAVQRTEGLIQAKVSKTKNILDLHSGLNPTPQKLPSLRARPCTGMLNRREVLSPSGTRAERNSTITGLMAISTPFDLIYMLLELVYFERFVTNLGS